MIEGRILEIGERGETGARVLLAMSGGVDSAAAAVLLQESGLHVVGMTMKNYCYGDSDVPERSCCSLEAIEDARAVCDRLDIPHMVVDVEEVFGREVTDNFIAEYRAARTPNPCVLCNSVVRFRTLADYANRMGIDFVATGHYARIFWSNDGRLYLARSRHDAKDQSYFLSALRYDDLRRVVFPLGEYRKADVREAARRAGLAVAEKPESQEVCFVPDGSLRAFLDGKIPFEPGDIENVSGEVIGRHEGLGTYTVGQRRGLGISAANPMYVVRLDNARNVLVVGNDSDLQRRELRCRLNWIDPVCVGGGVTAKIRSRTAAAPVERIVVEGDEADVVFAQPQRAIAPGQTIAFYTGDVVVGSGLIETVVDE
jgi:tRNA-specific 2-thiouridylase